MKKTRGKTSRDTVPLNTNVRKKLLPQAGGRATTQ